MGLAVPTTDFYMNLINEKDLVIDYDDLICMVHQLVALRNGWAWPMTKFYKEENETEIWIWKNKKEVHNG